MMRTLVSTTGELEYLDTFGFEDDGFEGVTYNFMSNFLWVLFIILMPILFANLLVSISISLQMLLYIPT